MSYNQTITKIDGCWFSRLPEASQEKVSDALKNGDKVEWEFSSFNDPGSDWQQIRVNGDVVPGSRSEAY